MDVYHSPVAALYMLLCALGALPMNASAAVPDVRVALPPRCGAVVRTIAGVFARQVSRRCGARVIFGRNGPASVTLALRPDLGAEAYEIADAPGGGVCVSGGDERGVLYGVGRLLRGSTFEGAFAAGAWRGRSAPAGHFRAIYAATHYANFYDAAPVKEVKEYIQDLGLWGADTLIVHFPTWAFRDLDEPTARASLRRTRLLLRAARDLGLQTGLVQCPNQGLASAPADTLASRFPDPMGRRGYFGVNCCPSSQAGHAYLMRLYERLLQEYRGVGLDYLVLWPYDEGGCGCERCWPWGARGFPAASRDLTLLARRTFPHVKAVLSTWGYDLPQAGEWSGLAQFVADHPGWLSAVMADSHLEFPTWPLENGTPGGLPLANFPEISMYGRDLWGGYGANPMPARFQRLWGETRGKVTGGMPYSEGIYEDINKAVCFQFYWDPSRTADQTLQEYAAFEFGPQEAARIAEAARVLERNWTSRGPGVLEAPALLRAAEAGLTPQARASWRWRILYLRGQIDAELYRRGGSVGGPVLKAAFDELRRIYHAERAVPVLRPPVVPTTGLSGPPVPAGHDRVVRSAGPIARWPDVRDWRFGADVTGLGDAYSVELWFWNGVEHNQRAVTGYLFSRGPEGPEGTGADSLGIGGTHSNTGLLFAYNGNARGQVVAGHTPLKLRRWYHAVFVRDGARVTVYLDGRKQPEVDGELPTGCPTGCGQLWLAGRNDGFASLGGKVAQVAVYGRALPANEAASLSARR